MRYRVLDLPAKGVGAFTPLPTTNPVASSQGLVHIAGSPGTLPVPVLSPREQWGAPFLSVDPATQPSNVSPNVIAPSIYIPSVMNMGPSQHFGMALRRFNPVPIPALSWISAAKRAMRSRRIGGRSVVDNPRAFQRYPERGQ